MVLIANGTLLMIQNMTWGGAQGFQTKPSDPFYIPYHDEVSPSTLAASGVFGTTHTERGLTWVSIDLSGHSTSFSLSPSSLSIIPTPLSPPKKTPQAGISSASDFALPLTSGKEYTS